MNITTLLRILREDILDDLPSNDSPHEDDYGWSTSYLIDKIAEAEKEAAERSLLLHDRNTAAICSVDVTASTATYTLDSRVYLVDKVLFDGELMDKVQVDDLDDYDSDWRTTEGTPTKFIQEDRKISLLPIPDADGTMTLEVYRRPLTDINNVYDDWAADTVYAAGSYVKDTDGEYLFYTESGGTSDAAEPTWDTDTGASTTDNTVTWTTIGPYKITPEIDEGFHRDLLYWAAHRAFSRRTENLYNEREALYYLNRFEEVFGRRRSARELQALRRNPETMRMTPTNYYGTRTRNWNERDW